MKRIAANDVSFRKFSFNLVVTANGGARVNICVNGHHGWDSGTGVLSSSTPVP